jgi:hypothetical protein
MTRPATGSARPRPDPARRSAQRRGDRGHRGVFPAFLPPAVLQVARAQVPSTTPGGRWPCPFCGVGYPIHQGWLIDYAVGPAGQKARAYVCVGCARAAHRVLAGPGVDA